MIDLFAELAEWLDPLYARDGVVNYVDVSQVAWVNTRLLDGGGSPCVICSVEPSYGFKCKSLEASQKAAKHLASLAQEARDEKFQQQYRLAEGVTNNLIERLEKSEEPAR